MVSEVVLPAAIRRKLLRTIVLFGVTGLLFTVGFVVLAVSGFYVLAAQCAAGAVGSLGWVVFMRMMTSPDLAPRVDTDDAGTTFRPDRRVDIGSEMAKAGTALTTAGLFYLPFLDADLWPAGIPALVAVAVGVALMCRDLRWDATRYLRLTPGGIQLSHGIRQRSCDWDRIRTVTGVAQNTWWPRPNDLVIVVSPTQSLHLSAGNFRHHDTALRDLVDFYWRHPEARGELVDGGAARRLAPTLTVVR